MKNLNIFILERLKLNNQSKLQKTELTNEELESLYGVLENFVNHMYGNGFEDDIERDKCFNLWAKEKPYGIFDGRYKGRPVKTFIEEFYNIIDNIIFDQKNFEGWDLLESLLDVNKIINCIQIEDIIEYFINLVKEYID